MFLTALLLPLIFPLFSSIPTEKRKDKFDDFEVSGVVNGILLGHKEQRSVQMTNELAEPLKIDCGSEEDDLGNLDIQPGHRIVWSFPVDENTWYECELWGHGGKHKIFEIYPGKRKTTQRLNWLIRVDGIYEGDMRRTKDIYGKRLLIRPKKVHRWNEDDEE